MNKINFTAKIEKVKKKRLQHLKNKEIKIIAETVRVMIAKDSKLLTAEDYNSICSSVYRKLNLSNRRNVYSMVNNVEVKEKINDSLIQYYINKGINVKDKLVELTNKSETLIKSTNDALNVAKFYKELIDEDKNKQTKIVEKHTYNSFDSYKLNKPDKVEQEISVEKSNEMNGGTGQHDRGSSESERPE